MGAKKTTTRRLGRDGRHESLIRAETEEIEPITKADAESLYERDLFEALDGYEKQARNTLEAAGLPTEYHRPYRRPDGVVCSDLSGLIDDDRKLEPEGYAAHMLEKVEDTRTYLEAGNAVQAARAAMLLQYLADYLHFSAYEEYTVIGRVQLEHGKHRKYTDQDKEKWLAIADSWWSDHPGLSLNNVAERVANETGHKFSSIKPYIANHNPNKKTG